MRGFLARPVAGRREGDKQVPGSAVEPSDPSRPIAGIGYPRTLGRLVEGKNINPETLLATDYLNHFNEIVMLLELVPSMPECFDDVKSWQPKGYAQHFLDTNFANRDLAILAYENAPVRYRRPFDEVVAHIDRIALEGIGAMPALIEANDPLRLEDYVGRLTRSLQKLIDIASAIIHGHEMTAEQSEIDILLDDRLAPVGNPAA